MADKVSPLSLACGVVAGILVTMNLHTMSSGDSATIRSGDSGDYHVSYHDRPSYGDNNFAVPGATVGEYTVTDPRGVVTHHPHGPHATTDDARRMGANPSAKAYAAESAKRHIMTGITRSQFARGL